MYSATCTHTITKPCKHYNNDCRNKCKKRPQTKSCHHSNGSTCNTCAWKEECDLIIPYEKYPKLDKLRIERLELLQTLYFLEDDKRTYHQIQNKLKKTGSTQKVEDIINLNITQIDNDIHNTKQQLRTIENGPYKEGQFQKKESYQELKKYAKKRTLKQLM